MSIRVHIDRVVLDGVRLSAGGSDMLQQALAGELTRLIRENGMPRAAERSGATDGVRAAGTMRIDPGSRPHRLGHGIARAVHGGLSR